MCSVSTVFEEAYIKQVCCGFKNTLTGFLVLIAYQSATIYIYIYLYSLKIDIIAVKILYFVLNEN